MRSHPRSASNHSPNSVAAVAACSAGEMTDTDWSSPGTGCSAPAENTCVALSDMKSKWSTTWDLASRLFASSCILSADAAPRLSCASARVDMTVRAADYRSGRICGQHITCWLGLCLLLLQLSISSVRRSVTSCRSGAY